MAALVHRFGWWLRGAASKSPTLGSKALYRQAARPTKNDTYASGVCVVFHAGLIVQDASSKTHRPRHIAQAVRQRMYCLLLEVNLMSVAFVLHTKNQGDNEQYPGSADEAPVHAVFDRSVADQAVLVKCEYGRDEEGTDGRDH